MEPSRNIYTTSTMLAALYHFTGIYVAGENEFLVLLDEINCRTQLSGG